MSTFYQIHTAVFSPTGGTSRAVTMLAEALEPDSFVRKIDLSLPQTRSEQFGFTANDLLIAAAPAYGGQIPKVRGLFSNLRGNQTPCIVMAAYGNRDYENALAQLKQQLSGQGFLCIGAIACVIPHIYSDKVGAGRPNANDKARIKDFAELVMHKLEQDNRSCPPLPGNPNPEPAVLKPVTKMLNDPACAHCRLCVRKCPVGAIRPDTLEIDDNRCINCMRCARLCPGKARSFDASAAKTFLEQNCIQPRPVEYFI